MADSLILFLSSLPVIWLLWILSSWLANFKSARRLNIPIFISPGSSISPIWMILRKPILPLLKALPFGLGSFTRFDYMGWTQDDKYRIHEQFGDVIILVTPTGNELYLSAAEAVDEIMSRKNDFPKPVQIYGKNL